MVSRTKAALESKNSSLDVSQTTCEMPGTRKTSALKLIVEGKRSTRIEIKATSHFKFGRIQLLRITV
jgi:hypothetical protein